MTAPLRVGGLVFAGFELLDLYGPLEMFGRLREGVSMELLGLEVGPVASYQGPESLAARRLADSGALDVLLVPGGFGTRPLVDHPGFLADLRAAANRSRYVCSVCTGSGLLARAGLLDGRRATTNKISFAWPMTQGPSVEWVRKARWVEDGKYFTSSGVSAGMDMALALIARLCDRATALDCARTAEYVWNEDATRDPFAD